MEDFIDILEDIESEDIETEMPLTRRPIKILVRVDHFMKLDETEFFIRFRMHKRTANIGLDIIRDSISSKSNKNRAVPPELKFLTALRFYASGGYLLNVSDHSGVHFSRTSKIVKQVSVALAKLCSQFIKLPCSAAEIRKLKAEFYSKTRFPNCIGAIDCTHVKIQSVGGDSAEIYRNRKGIFSINMQAICDSSLILKNIVARWPGSAHDSHIFNSSKVRRDLEIGLFGDGSVIVGDRGYACTNQLITPLDAVQTPEERLFQEAQMRTRNPIERCFGVWKRRFPVLALGIRLKIDRIESVIVATAILHNICTLEGEDTPSLNDEELEAIEALAEVPVNLDEHQRGITPNSRNSRHFVTRNKLIYEYFKGML